MKAARAVAFLLAVFSLVACRNSKITSLDRERGAPGEQFTIHGEDLDNFAGPDPVALPARVVRRAPRSNSAPGAQGRNSI